MAKNKNPASDPFLLPDGSRISLKDYDWDEKGITDKQKLFIIWYTLATSPTYMNAMQAALKAGYARQSARSVIYSVKKKYAKTIEKFERDLGLDTLMTTARRYLKEKTDRAEFDVSDFYELVEWENETTGQVIRKFVVKNFEDIPEDKRKLIDGVDVKGMYGTPVYVLPDKQKERDSLITWMEKRQASKDDDTEFDVETTADIIKGKLQVKTKIRKSKKSLAESLPEFASNPGNPIEEE